MMPWLLALSFLPACPPPDGTSTPSIETCNGEDDDWDGLIDEGPETIIWYIDSDGDGYGGKSSPCRANAGGSNVAAVTGDCDDDDAGTYPGAPEPVDSGVDKNCDGHLTNSRLPSLLYADEADAEVVGEVEWSELCRKVDGRGDFDRDGRQDLVISALIRTQGSSGTLDNEPRVYVVPGLVTGQASVDRDMTTLYEQSDGSVLGESISVGDLDGDGWRDLLLGVPGAGHTPAEEGPGMVAAFYEVPPGLLHAYRADGEIWGTSVLETFGLSIDASGDMDGDGRVDLVVGDPSGLVLGLPVGSFSVFYSAPLGEIFDRDADATVVSDLGFLDVNKVANDGDLNGDGRADFMIGTPLSARGACGGGGVSVFFGPLYGDVRLSDADVVFYSSHVMDVAGLDLTGRGDLNGDGYQDLVVGAPSDLGTCHGNDRRGRVYIVFGPLNPGEFDLVDADVILEGEAPEDKAGEAVFVPGDLDQDGVDDLLVGAQYREDTVYDDHDAGAAYLNYGPIRSSFSLGASSSVVRPSQEDTRLGYSFASGDFDADGDLEIVIGAPGQGTSAELPGSCYIFNGGPRKVPVQN